jgi:hypothetical protein
VAGGEDLEGRECLPPRSTSRRQAGLLAVSKAPTFGAYSIASTCPLWTGWFGCTFTTLITPGFWKSSVTTPRLDGLLVFSRHLPGRFL